MRLNVNSIGSVHHTQLNMDNMSSTAMRRVKQYERKLQSLYDGKIVMKAAQSVMSKNVPNPNSFPQAFSQDYFDQTSSQNDSDDLSTDFVEHSEDDAHQVEDKPHAVDMLNFLETGGCLSKVHARQAFAAYLTKVQLRLQHEVVEENFNGKQDEQMDLVLRFLKRAAVNLSVPFKVIVPSRKLASSDRRRILAKELGDFVHVYMKETDQLEIPAMIGEVSEKQFTQYIQASSEANLEEFLTLFTKLHKSASIFLGSCLPSNPKSGAEKPADKNRMLNRRCVSVSDQRDMTSQGDAIDKAESVTHSALGTASRGIVSDYDLSEVDDLMSKKSSRPSSAISVIRIHGPTGRWVPDSTSSSRIHRGMASYERSEEAIAQALHRLAKRQAARQYSTSAVPISRESPKSGSIDTTPSVVGVGSTIISLPQEKGDSPDSTALRCGPDGKAASSSYLQKLNSTDMLEDSRVKMEARLAQVHLGTEYSKRPSTAYNARANKTVIRRSQSAKPNKSEFSSDHSPGTSARLVNSPYLDRLPLHLRIYEAPRREEKKYKISPYAQRVYNLGSYM